MKLICELIGHKWEWIAGRGYKCARCGEWRGKANKL